MRAKLVRWFLLILVVTSVATLVPQWTGGCWMSTTWADCPF
jgi:hypothetical protein